MKKKTVSGIVLSLLLLSMPTLAFNIQPLSADLKTVKNQEEDGNGWQTQIVGHQISTSELEKLMSKLGVREEGRNYNPIIDGHGTGSRRRLEYCGSLQVRFSQFGNHIRDIMGFQRSQITAT